MTVHPLSFQHLTENPADEWIEVGEGLAAAEEHAHVAAECCEDAAEFGGDESGADHRHPSGTIFQGEKISGCQRQFATGHRQRPWSAAGGDENMPTFESPPARGNGMGIDKSAPLVDNLHAMRIQPLSVVAVEAGNVVFPGDSKGIEIVLNRYRLETVSGGITHCRGGSGRVPGKLFRYTAAVDAGASESVGLNQGDPGAVGGGVIGSGYTTAAAADNNKIKLCGLHGRIVPGFLLVGCRCEPVQLTIFVVWVSGMRTLAKLLAPVDLGRTVARALAEDIGSGDLTAALVPVNARARAHIIAREAGVVAGIPWAQATFRQVDPEIRLRWCRSDGDALSQNSIFCILEGSARAILTAERTALNFLQLLSGTATLARRYAAAVAGTGARVIDTRKTLPGLRAAQKYAVAAGGCGNHRMGLYDAILIKENHIAAAGGIGAALARAAKAGVPVEVEVENLQELVQALDAGAARILLDNFAPEGLAQAVAVTAGRAKLEASGNISLVNVREIAQTGVDYISVGDLTKNVRALDLSLRFEAEVGRKGDQGDSCLD